MPIFGFRRALRRVVALIWRPSHRIWTRTTAPEWTIDPVVELKIRRRLNITNADLAEPITSRSREIRITPKAFFRIMTRFHPQHIPWRTSNDHDGQTVLWVSTKEGVLIETRTVAHAADDQGLMDDSNIRALYERDQVATREFRPSLYAPEGHYVLKPNKTDELLALTDE